MKRFNEAVCVAVHPDFVHIVENPLPGVKLQVAVGDPFVAFASIPNNFGFGPGKFGAAVKLYSFRLTETNEIKVSMDFAAAPRCKKVFDFGKHIPDPIYGGASALACLTRGNWNSQAFHDRIDGGMVTQHARVHQALMDGVSRIWNEWVAGGCT
ncbi:MAG: hypothetical protein DMG57_24995 [Acidobacteria bacterium]|nr:MAG: hypothetical protein DMG57_24995 [Acidobacteriota bacterium]